MPLRPAWVITVHRAQGMSLDCGQICIEDAFAYGHAYVALSRLRSLRGLYLIAEIHPERVRIAPNNCEILSDLRECEAIAGSGPQSAELNCIKAASTLEVFRQQFAKVNARAMT